MDSENIDQSIISSNPENNDHGPWCLGLPRTGRRMLKEEERVELRQVYLRYLGLTAAWLLTLPFIVLCLVFLSPLSFVDRILIASLAVALELVIVVGVFISFDNPLPRALATYRDYRMGYVEQCEGKYEPEYSENSVHYAAFLGHASSLQSVLRDIQNYPDQVQCMEILPGSDRVWTLNNKRVSRWTNACWEGIARNTHESSMPRWYGPFNIYLILAGDSGCLFFLVAILITLAIYYMTGFPLPYSPLVLLSVWVIETSLIKAYLKKNL